MVETIFQDYFMINRTEPITTKEFYKTQPTLILRLIVQASRSFQTNRQCYLIALEDLSSSRRTFKVLVFVSENVKN